MESGPWRISWQGRGASTLAIGDVRFIPAIDGTNRIFVYSVNGNVNTWKLPVSWRIQTTLNLYELTTDGRNNIRAVHIINDRVTLATDALRAYVLTLSTDPLTRVNDLNLALTAMVTASPNDYGYDSATNMYSGMEYRYISNASTPKGLKAGEMIDGQGTIRFEMPIIGAFTANGVSNTYWSPNYDSARGKIELADNHAWLAYDFSNIKTVSAIKFIEIGTEGSRVTSFTLQYDNNGVWTDMYTGTSIPNAAIAVTPVQTRKVRLIINGAQANNPQIAQVEIR